jgi:serine/threonine protein kinase
VWSIGVIAYQLITHRLPFKCEQTGATAVEILNNPHEPIPDKLYSYKLRDIIKRMLTKDPEQRPSILELIRLPIIWDAVHTLIEEFEGKIFYELRDSLLIALPISSVSID